MTAIRADCEGFDMLKYRIVSDGTPFNTQVFDESGKEMGNIERIEITITCEKMEVKLFPVGLPTKLDLEINSEDVSIEFPKGETDDIETKKGEMYD